MTSHRESIHQTIHNFLSLIDQGLPTSEENEKSLVRLLDQLALAAHDLKFDFDEKDYPDAPNRDQNQLRALVSARFPNYGFYNLPERISIGTGESGCVVADAIDDIIDIANDLYDVDWRWHNTNQDDALWSFEESFENHWSGHLRGLQLYLQHLNFDEE